jgi:hypothetical protein
MKMIMMIKISIIIIKVDPKETFSLHQQESFTSYMWGETVD